MADARARREPLRAEGAELVGAWGMQIHWNDGHETGIYAWSMLRAWRDERRSNYPVRPPALDHPCDFTRVPDSGSAPGYLATSRWRQWKRWCTRARTIGAGLRMREVVALAEVAAECPELGELVGGLDALGGDREAERVAELHDGRHDRGAFGVAAEALDERAVDLQRVHRERTEIRERRLAGAEVVDADAHAELGRGGAARRPRARGRPSASSR